jgi:hypothetical protein
MSLCSRIDCAVEVTEVARQVEMQCTSCGMAFVFGPIFWDFIRDLRKCRLRRTLDFDYDFYCGAFAGDEGFEVPDDEITLTNCDSIFLGCLVDPDMRCPKCGEFAFAEAND